MTPSRHSLILCAALVAGLAFPSVASEQGLVAHFTFDNAAHFGYDSVRQAEIGNVEKQLSAASDPASCDGAIIGGMAFQPAWYNNNYMLVPGADFSSSQGIPCGNQAVSYSIWINPAQSWGDASLGTMCTLLRRGYNGSEWSNDTDHHAIWLVKGDNDCPKIAFAAGNTWTASTSAIYQSPTPFDGNWHFIVATYTNRTLTLYYDATNKVEQTLGGDCNIADSSALWLGFMLPSSDWYSPWTQYKYIGAVDDLKVYNCALGGDEVRAAYDTVMNPPEPTPSPVPLTADASVAEFPRLAGETNDAPRIQRAIDATKGGVLYLPRGDYDIASTLLVTNRCSLLMHKSATLKAVATMDYVVRVRNDGVLANLDFLCFIQGGAIDGNGLASCLFLEGCQRQSLDDIKILNGTTYGLHVGGDAEEVVAKGLYFLCRKHGLAGNTAMVIQGDGGHYTDIHILDWTTGAVVTGRSNRLTRFHAWGGSLSPAIPGDIPEMLPGSTSFRIEGDSTILRDCYADTSQTGFAIHDASDVRILGCSYYNNSAYGLNDLTIVRQTGNCGALLVANCVFSRSGTGERITVYDGNGGVTWRDIIYGGDWSGIVRPGRD